MRGSAASLPLSAAMAQAHPCSRGCWCVKQKQLLASLNACRCTVSRVWNPGADGAAVQPAKVEDPLRRDARRIVSVPATAANGLDEGSCYLPRCLRCLNCSYGRHFDNTAASSAPGAGEELSNMDASMPQQPTAGSRTVQLEPNSVEKPTTDGGAKGRRKRGAVSAPAAASGRGARGAKRSRPESRSVPAHHNWSAGQRTAP